MANEARVRGNLTSGTLSVALAAGDTTMSSAGLANLPAVTAANHAVLTIENELVYVTAHTAAATTATIQRGKEGTSAASHGLNVAWVHGPVVSDFDSVLGYQPVTADQTGMATTTDLTNGAAIVTVPYAGHRVKITGFARIANDGLNTIRLDVREGATILGYTQKIAGAANVVGGEGLMVVAVSVPSAGSHTYKLTYVASGGTGASRADTTSPAYILVEDLGPAL